METVTVTLTEFLLARIAEDEARVDTMPDWHCTDSGRGEGWGTRGACPICDHYMFDGTEDVTENAMWEHLEQYHQRARVLAECGVKRRIVEDAEKRLESPRSLRHFAAVYADHPDYDEAWRS